MKKYIIGVLLAVMLSSSCAKDWLLIDAAESGQIGPEYLSDVKEFEKAVAGIYHEMYLSGSVSPGQGWVGEPTHKFIGDLMSGSIAIRNTQVSTWYLANYQLESFVAQNDKATISAYFWQITYGYIHSINTLLAISVNASGTDELYRYHHSLGELYTLRAFMYHRLNVHFAFPYDHEAGNGNPSVPIRSNVSFNPLPRSTVAQVVQFIKDDLALAKTNFDLVLAYPKDRFPANLVANANVMHMTNARMLLYTKDYPGALAAAEMIINGENSGAMTKRSLMSSTIYNTTGFNTINTEWIWGFKYNTDSELGMASYPVSVSANYGQNKITACPFSIDTDILAQIAPADTRLARFILDTDDEIKTNREADAKHYQPKGYFTSGIYQGNTNKNNQWVDGAGGAMDISYMRLAEAYYIAAEAAYLGSREDVAQIHLNAITQKYNPAFVALTGEALYTQIKNYKFFDMFMEGRSLEDVKRRGVNVLRSKSGHPGSNPNARSYGPNDGGAGTYLSQVFTFYIPDSDILNSSNQLVQTVYLSEGSTIVK